MYIFMFNGSEGIRRLLEEIDGEMDSVGAEQFIDYFCRMKYMQDPAQKTYLYELEYQRIYSRRIRKKLRLMEELSGISNKSVKFDDADVLSLIKSDSFKGLPFEIKIIREVSDSTSPASLPGLIRTSGFDNTLDYLDYYLWMIHYLRMIWYKIYYPVEFYSALLSIDATIFDYSILAEGKRRIKPELYWFNQEWGLDYEFDYSNGEGYAAMEKEVFEIAMECYEKDIKFLPADINISDPYRFLPEDGAIRMPFNCPERIDKPSVEVILQERAKKPFQSLEDFKNRTKLSDWFIHELGKNKCFGSFYNHNSSNDKKL